MTLRLYYNIANDNYLDTMLAMKTGFVYLKNHHSTYFLERGNICRSNYQNAQRFRFLENVINSIDSYSELVQHYEIKTLDQTTSLKELKIDRIRVVHFLFENDTFVYLGTFLKKTKKTPKNEIEKNNQRIKQYLAQRREKDD